MSGGADGCAPAVCAGNSDDILRNPAAGVAVVASGGAGVDDEDDVKTMSSSRPNRFAGFLALTAAVTACCFCRPRCSSRRCRASSTAKLGSVRGSIGV